MKLKLSTQFRKVALTGLYMLAIPLSARAQGKQPEPAKIDTAAVNTVSWTRFVEKAKNGTFKKVEIYDDHVAGYADTLSTDADTAQLQRQKPHTESSVPARIAAEELVKDKVDVTFRFPIVNVWRDFFMGLVQTIVGVALMAFLLLGALRRFGPGNAKSFDPVEPKDNKTRFADVAGADGAKSEIAEIVEFIRDPAKFARLGGRCPKGALLTGDPGVGKTLLAKAVAGEAGRPFFSLSGSDFVEVFAGAGAGRLRKLMKTTEKYFKLDPLSRLRRKINNMAKAGPVLIFVDEIDAVGRTRGSGQGGGADGERDQTLNQLLVCMDGFEASNVIWIAATNRPDILDPALLRPGRFDRQIPIDLPDAAGRKQILEIHTKDKPLAADVDLREIARLVPGFSGAQLANLANEAAILAARRNGTSLAKADFRDAVDKVLIGIEKPATTDLMRRALYSYHEIGHTIAMLHEESGSVLHKVTIIPRGRTGGHAFPLPKEDGLKNTVGQFEAMIRIAVAGRVAERLIFGDNNVTAGAQGDIQMATEYAKQMIMEYGMSEMGMLRYSDTDRKDSILTSETIKNKIAALAKKKVDEAEEFMTKVLEKNVDKLHLLAQELSEKETLDPSQIKELIGDVDRVDDLQLAALKPGIGIKKIARPAAN